MRVQEHSGRLSTKDYVAALWQAGTSSLGDSELRRAAALILDTVAVARMGAAAVPLQAFGVTIVQNGPSSTVLAGVPWTTPPEAALVNASAAVWNELDEGIRGAGHPGAHVVTAAGALAEAEAVTGRALIDAVVLGYQLQADLGAACALRPEVHSHGALGAPAAALAAARVLGLDPRRAAHAVGIAADLAPAGSFSSCTDGRTVRHLFAGTGAGLGVRAAQLARAGFEATDDAVATAYGTVRGTVFADFPHPARPWAISRGYLKTWSACAYTHTALDLTAQLRERHCLDDAEVDSVSIAVPAIGRTVAGLHTRTPLAVRFSLPILVATVLSRPDANTAFDVAAEDPAILALAERVTVYEDPVLTARWPRHMPARVDVYTRLGETHSATADDPWTPPDDEAYVAAVLAKATALPGSPRPVAAADVAALIASRAVRDLFGPVTAPRTGFVPSP